MSILIVSNRSGFNLSMTRISEEHYQVRIEKAGDPYTLWNFERFPFVPSRNIRNALKHSHFIQIDDLIGGMQRYGFSGGQREMVIKTVKEATNEWFEDTRL